MFAERTLPIFRSATLGTVYVGDHRGGLTANPSLLHNDNSAVLTGALPSLWHEHRCAGILIGLGSIGMSSNILTTNTLLCSGGGLSTRHGCLGRWH